MTNLPQSGTQFAVRSVSWIATQPVTDYFVRPATLARLLLPALLFVMVAPSMLGQALPAAEAAPISTGFALPRAAGTLNYAVSASEGLSWGLYGNQGAASGTSLTGDLGYISNSKLYPFSAVFSGGHSWSTTGSGQPSYSFLNLGMSQVLNVKKWSIVVSDGANYIPATPTTGLSGVPGVGDLGVSPVQVGADTGQGILTNYSSRVNDTVTGGVQRPLTGKTSFSASGSYGICVSSVSAARGWTVTSRAVGAALAINLVPAPHSEVTTRIRPITFRAIAPRWPSLVPRVRP